ncbi:transmembrane emp24 domain-containing protein 1b [Cynoglossus semilaevis]|uniref:transmembrane emp24 domain-containing protein 1b n=1 Tax=Cynoglossus semilaevis TaxID=244447 RepID=UPI000495BB73|nr:transmembrane emp24 domain-containing protein 1-like [Cynoglossus semilaevis]
MKLFRWEDKTQWRPLVFTLVFGCCLGSVCCLGQSQDSELTFMLPAGKSECFFQTTIKNLTMEIEYQVIAGAGMDVNFEIISPQGIRLVADSRRSDGVHIVETTEEGDYQICFDNSFSRFSEKMVFFEILTEAQAGDVVVDDEWTGLEEPDGTLLEYKLDDIREYMDTLHRHLERSRHMQTALRAFEARDRNLLEENLWRVSFWSCASMLVMLCVALTQVYTVRKLFDDKRKVYT